MSRRAGIHYVVRNLILRKYAYYGKFFFLLANGHSLLLHWRAQKLVVASHGLFKAENPQPSAKTNRGIARQAVSSQSSAMWNCGEVYLGLSGPVRWHSRP